VRKHLAAGHGQPTMLTRTHTLTRVIHTFLYPNAHTSSSKPIHVVTGGKEGRVSFSDGKNKFEINFRLENCYRFLELIITVTVLHRAPGGRRASDVG